MSNASNFVVKMGKKSDSCSVVKKQRFRVSNFFHRQECDDHLKPDEMLHNIDYSFITRNQNHRPCYLSKNGDVPEFQVTNRLIYNHSKKA